MPQTISRPSASAYGATSVSPARHDRKRRLSPFWRHFLEMFAVMMVGMIGSRPVRNDRGRQVLGRGDDAVCRTASLLVIAGGHESSNGVLESRAHGVEEQHGDGGGHGRARHPGSSASCGSAPPRARVVRTVLLGSNRCDARTDALPAQRLSMEMARRVPRRDRPTLTTRRDLRPRAEARGHPFGFAAILWHAEMRFGQRRVSNRGMIRSAGAAERVECAPTTPGTAPRSGLPASALRRRHTSQGDADRALGLTVEHVPDGRRDFAQRVGAVDDGCDAVVKNPIVGQKSKNPALREWHTNNSARCRASSSCAPCGCATCRVDPSSTQPRDQGALPSAWKRPIASFASPPKSSTKSRPNSDARSTSSRCPSGRRTKYWVRSQHTSPRSPTATSQSGAGGRRAVGGTEV